MKYFLHDTSAIDDEKLSELYTNFGYEGIGLFYVILEKVAKQEKPIKTSVLKRQLDVGKRLEKCWMFMEEIGLISSSNGETFNEQLLNYAEKYKIKKEKNTERILKWRTSKDLQENVTRYSSVTEHDCNASKVKESKEKKSKENKSKKYNSATADFEDKSVFQRFLDEYNSFLLDKTETTEKFSVAGRAGLKQIVEFLISSIKKKNESMSIIETEVETELRALDGWKYILTNFEKWDVFHQKQLKLEQINSNITNILSSIKNGTGTRQGAAKSGNEIIAEQLAQRHGGISSDRNNAA